ncbi:HEAT repeat domain-containing protein [Streptomyces sp. 15-116A]|uniref:HEAT repeat domain-containing protein n=1 Tax=Streptomyces sp. 15-116A TaxID=2259035 RepID=UPI0021B1EAAE|nr:HEAT repeat domain-containing protein [Streptomyces sp. 15-116A]MCT7351018.1 HEAT repeat domain-containing protein [Streptomyces sp. 15-116A]
MALSCYSALHADRPLENPPVELFLTFLRHDDALVRAAAASGLNTVGAGVPEEGRVVNALTAVLEDDPDPEVVFCAASALSHIRCADAANSRLAARALARHAASSAPRVRAASVEGALLRDEPDAHRRLTAELHRPDVEGVFVSVAGGYASHREADLPDAQRTELIELLERLREEGWAHRPREDDDSSDADFRAGELERAQEALRTFASRRS